MARVANAPRSFERLHHVRARLRKASCMGSDAHDDIDHDEDGGGDESEDETRTAHPLSSAHRGISPAPPAPASDAQDGAPSSSSTSQAVQVQIQEADPQAQSAFFNRLPPEVRRMVYTHVWRLSNPTLALHIHAACDGARLTHTPCCTTTTPTTTSPSSSSVQDDNDDDPMRTDPWPGWRGRNQPPRWFWHAWGLRMRWGSPHWRCQAEAMLSWRARADGTCADDKGAPGMASGYLPVFLTSRRVYAEAIESFLESTTLIFTASEDAYRFFVQSPYAHPHTHKIRNLQLAFTHFKDHLFLQRIEPKHPRLPDSQLGVPVSWSLWSPLMRCVREDLPELRRLTVHLCAAAAPAAREEAFMDVLRGWAAEGYGTVEEKGGGLVYTETGGRMR